MTDFGDTELDYSDLKERDVRIVSLVFDNEVKCSNTDYETATALGISTSRNEKLDIGRVKSVLLSKIATLDSKSINFLVENITIKDYENENLGDWRLRIAPNIPLFDDFVFNHHTIVFECYRSKSRLGVRRISLQRVSKRPYFTEGILSGPVLLINDGTADAPDNTYMDSEDFEWLLTLPKRRKNLESRLKEWNDYLSTHLKSIQNKQGWIAYENLVRISPTKAELKISANCHSYNAHKVFFAEDEVLVLRENKPKDNDWRPNESTNTPERFGTIEKGIQIKQHLAGDNKQKSKKEWVKWIIDLNDNYIYSVDKKLSKSDDSYRDPLDKVPKSGLLVNSIFADELPLTLQQKAIHRLNEGNAVNPRLEDFVFDIKEATEPIRNEEIEPETLVETHLNEHQRMALETSLNSPDISLIQGPPGTGKTTVIAELCHQTALRGGKVLLASQSNLAVDNALSRLTNRSIIMPIRLGRHTTDEGQDFVEENVVKRWFEGVKDNVNNIVKKREDFLALNENYNTAITTLEKCDAQRIRLSSERNSRKESLRLIQSTITGNEHSKKECDKQLVSVSSRLNALNIVLSQKEYPKRNDFCNFCDMYPDTINEVNNSLKMLFQESEIDYTTNLDLNELGEIIAYLDYPKNDIENLQKRLGSLSKLISQVDLLKNDEILNLEKEKDELVCEISAITNPEIMQSLSNKLIELNKQIGEQLVKNNEQRLGDQWKKDITSLRHDFEKLSSLIEFTNSGEFKDFIDDIKRSLKADKKYKLNIKKLICFINQIHAHPLKVPEHLMDELSKDLAYIEFEKKQIIQRIDDIKCELESRVPERDELEKDIDSITMKLENINKKVELNLKYINSITKSENTFYNVMDDTIFKSLKVSFDDFKETSKEKLTKSKRWLNLQKIWVEKINQSSTDEYENLINIYIDLANVVGATCIETGKYKFWKEKGREFDLVIIDEVSKATLPELLMPMLLGKQIVLVGDHQQLPPIFRMNEDELTLNEIDDEEQIKELLKKYEHLVTSSYFREMFEDADELLKARLVIQYRMHPAIMNAINQFYPHEHRLQNGIENPDENRKNIYLIKGKNGDLSSSESHLMWIDTGKLLDGRDNLENKESGRFKSRYNEFEVQCIRKILISFNKQFEQHAIKDGKSQDIAIISFYAGQIRKLRQIETELLNSNLINNLKCRIGTVDRFQGMESPIVIVSLVSSPKGNKPTSFVKEFRRINVAFSRAQSLLVIVGSAQTFRSVDVKINYDGKVDKRQSYGEIINSAKTGMNGNCFIRGYDVI